MNDDQQLSNTQQVKAERSRRVNVELPSAFGGRKIQQLDIQGGKTHPTTDFNWYILNQLGVPARISDVIADLLLWIAASTFVGSVGKQLIRLPGVSAIAAVILAVTVVFSIYILKIATEPKVRWAVVYRWFLILLGVSLGVR